MISRAHIGRSGEDAAEHYLQKQGYAIIKKNYRIRGGEIDIIAKKRDDLVFFEVKSRSMSTYGYPEQSVGGKKAFFIARAIREYIRKARIPNTYYIRFDIIAVERESAAHSWRIHHIENVDLPMQVA